MICLKLIGSSTSIIEVFIVQLKFKSSCIPEVAQTRLEFGRPMDKQAFLNPTVKAHPRIFSNPQIQDNLSK